MTLNVSGNYNSSFGSHALYNNIAGNSNVAFGNLALLRNTIASFNSAVGDQALELNTTGMNNSAFGYQSLWLNNYGNSNVGIGNFSLNQLGSDYTSPTNNLNTAVGFQAGSIVTRGNNNTFLGSTTDVVGTTDTFSNSTAIGANAKISQSNQIVLGGLNGNMYPNILSYGKAFLPYIMVATFTPNTFTRMFSRTNGCSW
jgi:hypothetical protein